MSSKSSKDQASLCAFNYSDGRQCRMLRATPRTKFCLHHERKTHQLQLANYVGRIVSEPISGGFVPANALTQSLSSVLGFVAEGNLSPKAATAIARVAETLLKSISLSNEEFKNVFVERYFDQLIRESFGDLPDDVPPTPRPTPKPAPPPDTPSSCASS